MKNIKKIFWAFFLANILFVSCDPNKDLYDKMDEAKEPHEETIEYTLTEADYSRFEGFIAEYKAFSDNLPAMDYIPDILKVRYVTLQEESSAMVTFNHFLLHPDWWDSGFGYKLTDDDYAFIGTGSYFTPENPAKNHLPDFIEIKLVDNPQAEDKINVIYNFRVEGEEYLYLDTYEFDGEDWIWIETTEDIPYVGYELTAEDYEILGEAVAQFNSFNDNHPPEIYLPAFLRNLIPYAKEGDEQVVKYRYYDGTQTTDIVDKYTFDGVVWNKVSYFEERSEQYIYGDLGWAFDPTVRFTMGSSDYQHLVDIDPIGQQEFQYDDFAYYYGASVFYSNFDIRLIGRRLDKLESGEYADPELGEIYETEGSEAAADEMLRRIVEEGIIKLLQHKYPDANPQEGGIDVRLFVGFQTFADNWVRRYPEAEYICTAAGDPPQFELVRGPYYPEEDDE